MKKGKIITIILLIILIPSGIFYFYLNKNYRITTNNKLSSTVVSLVDNNLSIPLNADDEPDVNNFSNLLSIKAIRTSEITEEDLEHIKHEETVVDTLFAVYDKTFPYITNNTYFDSLLKLTEKIILELENPVYQPEALLKLTSYLTINGDFEKALEILLLLEEKSPIKRPAVIEKLKRMKNEFSIFELDNIYAALSELAEDIPYDYLKQEAYSGLAISSAYHTNDTALALSFTEKITDKELRDKTIYRMSMFNIKKGKINDSLYYANRLRFKEEEYSMLMYLLTLRFSRKPLYTENTLKRVFNDIFILERPLPDRNLWKKSLISDIQTNISGDSILHDLLMLEIDNHFEVRTKEKQIKTILSKLHFSESESKKLKILLNRKNKNTFKSRDEHIQLLEILLLTAVADHFHLKEEKNKSALISQIINERLKKIGEDGNFSDFLFILFIKYGQ